MPFASLLAIVIIAAGGVLLLLQLWFDPLPPALFWKVMITLGVVLVVIVVVALILREYWQERRLRDKDLID
ncbi:MAG: hypothetical protein ACT4NU_09165 [Chromatiales bacterium]